MNRLKVAAMVSVGSHPASGRPCRAPLDARAVEMGLGLDGAELQMVHAGDPDNPALRDYLGMGLPTLTVLQQPAQGDSIPALLQWARREQPELLLLGCRANGGEDSGMAPFLLAQALGYAVVVDAVQIEVRDRELEIVQALPRGQRRLIRAELPCVVAVGAAAPAPRQSAYGPARRGRIAIEPVEPAVDIEAMHWEIQPARKRPKRLKVVKAKTAAERFMAATAVQGGGKTVRGVSPTEAARVIYDYLKEEELVTR
ncbi:MAG: electron transfer flavoprotein subunit beta [Candidatus Thiodiazotropha sp.]